MNKKNKNPRGGTRDIPTLTPIAIIGLSGIMPDAENIDRLWQNIIDEANCIKEIPTSRWNIADYYDPDPSAPDKTYSKYGGFIPDIQFDPMEFGLPPNLLEVTDVSQLLSLVVAKDALRDAGYLEASEAVLNQTGVILGMVGMSSKIIHPLLNRLQYPIWEKVLRSSSVPENEIPEIIEKMKSAYIQWNENAFPGAIGNVVAGRIANRLDLGGANCIVDAACASSLAAVNMAVSELALGKADMMITGGVDTDNSILTYLCFSKTPAFSKGEKVRSFSEDSDGMLSGEGIGMLVLKRLADAERDGNRVYAVIRGIGASSDGHFKSIYAPRPSGQAKAIRRAYEHANYSPSTVRLIEAHGTGTIAGDPAEFQGLSEVFTDFKIESGVIALGSIKSQIGHTKATAGAASLIKTTLALHQKILPATINVTNPHPDMKIEETPFYINTETRPWFAEPGGNPRRAGVSSFGFGGTNFHITLEEYTGNNDTFSRRNPVPNSIILQAETPGKLLEVCQTAINALKSPHAEFEFDKLDHESSANEIPVKNPRVGFVAQTITDALDLLSKCVRMLESTDGPETWSHPGGINYRSSAADLEGKVVALFPGQGSQYVNMGKELALTYPRIRTSFEKADAAFFQENGIRLSSTAFPIPVFSDEDRQKQKQALTRTLFAQPAIGTLSLAMYQILKEAGFSADHFAGHSFGELTALYAAEVYDEDAFIRLAIARGKAMETRPSSDSDTGTMIAVKGDIKKVQEIVSGQDSVTIANFNSTTQVVLAGSTAAIGSFKQKLENLGFSVYPLNVSAAFHTQFVAHAQAPFREAIRKETFAQPKHAVYSNSTGNQHSTDPQTIKENLENHILNAVKFKEEIEKIYNNRGRIFIEIGPKNILTNLVKEILADQPHETITLNPNPQKDSDLQFRQAIVMMRVLGFQLGNIDPYRTYKQKESNKQSKVTVTLNGGHYITKKTQDTFLEALANLHQKDKSMEKNQNVLEPSGKPLPDQIDFKQNMAKTNTSNSKNISPLIEKLQEHQDNILNAHQHFLTNDSLSKEATKELVSTEITLLSRTGINTQSADQERALALLEKRVESLNNQQNSISLAHQEFLRSQAEFTDQYIKLIRQLAEKINFAVKIPDIQPEKEFGSEDLHGSIKNKILPEVKPAPLEEPIAVQKVEIKDQGIDQNQLKSEFLDIVSEKTGYPSDMLEIGMDMEADLGIDSIKRVEILGAMQEKFPELPTIPADDLVELRTLEQIITHFISTEQQPAISQFPAKSSPSPSEKTSDFSNLRDNSVSDSDLQTAFLNIVSEKTGYPTDMLELEMDIEADLGIDSIKRVEILGAMQEEFPELPPINAETLAELRTLKQIIDQFGSGHASDDHQSKKGVAVSEAAPTLILKSESLETRNVTLKTLPKPDYMDFHFKPNSLVLITSDGSGKAEKLAEQFSTQKVESRIIHFNKPPKNIKESSNNGLKRYYISGPDDVEIKSCMSAIIDEQKEISAFIHLNPKSKENNDHILISTKNSDLLKSIFLIARHLGKPLSDSSVNGRSAFLTVTNMDGKLGLDGSNAYDVISGGFAGLSKSLRLEWPDVFCRAIDIHPEIDVDTYVSIINSELHDPDNTIAEVGLTPNGRFTISTN